MIINRCVVAVVLSCLLFAVGVQAQTFSGQITGIVKDSSGAVIPGVSVTAKNEGTNFTRTILSNESGVYTIPNIPIGTYEVTAELTGFQTQIRKGVTLQVGDSLRINFDLTVGQTTESVTVTGEAPIIQSESAALGTVINNKTVLEMPLNGRVFYDLVNLVPGAVAPAPGSSQANRGGVSIAGSREGSNSFTIDGIDNGSAGTNGPQIKLSVETLQEFKVLTNAYSPEFGRGSGGQVIMTTRSGTSDYRGTVWEFLRNSKMDAKNLFDPPDCDQAAPGQFCAPIAPLNQNEFGYVFGGPVPKIKNFFFFSSYEGLRQRKSLSSLATVPAAAFHQGDFSSVRTAIRDPLTGAAFPNNVIPSNRWDRVGKAILDLYPNPTSDAAASNLLTTPLAVKDNDQATARLDYNFGKNSVYARHIYNRELIREPFPGRGATNGVPGFGWDNALVGNTFSTGTTIVMTPRLIANIRYGMTHMWESLIVRNLVPYNQQIGLCCTSTDPINFGRPSISLSNYTGIGDYGSAPGGRDEYINEWNYTQNILTGNHNLTAGFNFRLVHIDHLLPNVRRGSFTFDGTWTGNPVADLLLGYARQSSITPDTSNFRTHQRGKNPSMFFNDDWKVTPNLTVNLGVRYEFSLPMLDANDAIASFDFATGKIVVPDVTKLTPGSIDPSLVENSPYGRGMRHTDYLDLQPRIGIAYTLNPKTVIRSGYGVFTDVLTFGNSQISFVQNSPWFPTKTYRTDTTTGPVISLSQDPFPNRVFSAPLLSVQGWDPDFRDGYVQNWNLSVQRELMGGLALELAYIGSSGTKLFSSSNINQSFLVGGPLGSGSQQSRKLYPAFSSVNRADDVGTASFHSLQTKLERRFASGFSLLGTYMWSKNMESGSGQEIWRGQEKGLSGLDARHRAVTNFIYALPAGPNHAHFKEGPLSYVLGGWQLSGILTLQAGRPATPSLSGDISNTGGTTRPIVVGDPNDGPKTTSLYWNKDAFILPAANTFGNAGRNILIGPGMRAFDMSLQKSFVLDGEAGRRIQFRSEFFNIFNHPILGQPNSTVNGPNFGQISGTLVNTTSRQIQLALKLYF